MYFIDYYNFKLIKAVADGDLIEVRKLFRINGEVDIHDYDKR